MESDGGGKPWCGAWSDNLLLPQPSTANVQADPSHPGLVTVHFVVPGHPDVHYRFVLAPLLALETAHKIEAAIFVLQHRETTQP